MESKLLKDLLENYIQLTKNGKPNTKAYNNLIGALETYDDYLRTKKLYKK